MCGRYELKLYPWLADYYRTPLLPIFQPNFDLRPTDPGLIVRVNKAGERECVPLRWGLIPSWAKDIKFGSKCFNARAEGIETTPAFRSAFKTRRCLVPAMAFFEWSGEKGRKTKHRITRRDGEPITFAGLWEVWREPAGTWLQTFTIITCEPNAQLRALHNRMPVILDKTNFDNWLDNARADLLRPYASELQIDPAVSQPAS